jgi:hypothetical protein
MKPLFEEKQRFTQWWLWTMVVSGAMLVLGIFGNALYVQMVLGKPWGDKPMSDDALIGLTLFCFTAMLVMLMVFFNAMLEIVVDKSSVSYRYFPVIRKWRRIEREEIHGFEMQDYYLKGYGIHYDLRGNKSITVKGNSGIQLTMANGSKLLLGTQQPEEFLTALKKMKNRSED